MTTLEVLDRIASGRNIYSFICANGEDVIKAAAQGAEAIREREKLDKRLKCWEIKEWSETSSKKN